MIPALWLRLVVVIAFSAWMATREQWLIAVVGAGLTALTAWQLISAYRRR